MNLQILSTPMACNEQYFHLPRVRNAPIKSSMTSVDGLPKKLKLYRIAGSKYWQMRLYNMGRYLVKSLKTTDLEEAKSAAGLIFESLEFGGEYVEKPGKAEPYSDFKNQQLLHDLLEEVLAAELQKVSRDEI